MEFLELGATDQCNSLHNVQLISSISSINVHSLSLYLYFVYRANNIILKNNYNFICPITLFVNLANNWMIKKPSSLSRTYIGRHLTNGFEYNLTLISEGLYDSHSDTSSIHVVKDEEYFLFTDNYFF